MPGYFAVDGNKMRRFVLHAKVHCCLLDRFFYADRAQHVIRGYRNSLLFSIGSDPLAEGLKEIISDSLHSTHSEV